MAGKPAAATSYGDVAYLHGWTVAIGRAAASRMTKGALGLGLREKATVSKLMAQCEETVAGALGTRHTWSGLRPA